MSDEGVGRGQGWMIAQRLFGTALMGYSRSWGESAEIIIISICIHWWNCIPFSMIYGDGCRAPWVLRSVAACYRPMRPSSPDFDLHCTIRSERDGEVPLHSADADGVYAYWACMIPDRWTTAVATFSLNGE